MGMIDINRKEITKREATVEGRVLLKPAVITAIKRNKLPKGNVLEAARLAGILAAKKTPQLVPLCHPIAIDFVDISFILRKKDMVITATVKADAKTGVEMEAFTATAVAALVVYDMCKALDRGATISRIRLLKKTGGKSGSYIRE